jgi:outer membrane protein TolC
LFLPSLGLESRYTEQRGTLDLGDVVNPVHGALNELTGGQRFPTDVEIVLPLRHDTRLRLTQTVIDASIVANHAVARHRYAAQVAARAGAARRLAAEVQAAYLDVASARSAARILESALERVREGERVAQRLVDAGHATPDGLYRARADRSEIAQQLDEARRSADAAVRTLNQLLGRPLSMPVTLLPDSVLMREIDLTEDEAVAAALSGREELTGLDAGARAADAGVRLATASLIPSLAVALDYGFQGRDVEFGASADYFVATVVARWNVFSGGHDLARREGARLEADRVRAERREAEERVRLDVLRAYEAAVVARAAIATAEDRLVAARRTFELVRRRYEEGVANHIELVDARATLTGAELNRALTLYRYAMRTVDLERAAALRAID